MSNPAPAATPANPDTKSTVENEREDNVFMAKLAEQAERYEGDFFFFFPNL